MEKLTIPQGHRKNIIRFAIGTGVILLIPLIAMQFTHEILWSAADFIFAAVLLFGTGLLYELTAGRIQDKKYRRAAAAVFIAALLLIWAEFAVGIFGS